MQFRSIRVFTEYFINGEVCATANSLTIAKKKVLKDISGILSADPDHQFTTNTRFYVKLPFSSAHTQHPVGERSTIGQKMDKRLEDKIYELVQQNITRPTEVQRLLRLHVEESLFAGVSTRVSARGTDKLKLLNNVFEPVSISLKTTIHIS